MADPIAMSGHGELSQATAPAATSTPEFEITSLREHSNVLAMFTSCERNRRSSRRQIGNARLHEIAFDIIHYFDISGNMELPDDLAVSGAVSALASLAQEHRLAAFRLLVQAGPEGMAAGELANALGVPNSSLSFHLAHLNRAGLIGQRRLGRSLIYTANYDAMNGLVAFLTENCCGGTDCSPAASPKSERKSA